LQKKHNKNYKNWEAADFTIVIIGSSCVHNKVVKKRFKKGTVVLKAGGPIFILGNLNINKNIIDN
jgi:hypothetical protein